MIFTDPPFGANINYSEMNFLWEAWLGDFTDNTNEAVMNRVQGKGLDEYGRLMSESLRECYRVLRPNHWMLLVFMNSSEAVWRQLRDAILGAGFSIEKIDVFDKKHGTFKQFVSENTAGADLVLHCRKGGEKNHFPDNTLELTDFLDSRRNALPLVTYKHVSREDEIDFRKLYSDWLAQTFVSRADFMDFAKFRQLTMAYLEGRSRG